MKIIVERFFLSFREIILLDTFHHNMKGHWLSYSLNVVYHHFTQSKPQEAVCVDYYNYRETFSLGIMSKTEVIAFRYIFF